MGGGDYYAVQGGSRILNATRVDQSGSDDADVTNWWMDDDFILAVNINSGGKDTVAAQYKLRFRGHDLDPWEDVGAATAIHYNATTDLVNGTNIAVGGRKCDSQGGDTWQAGEEVEGASLSDSIDLADEYETELHFALGFSGIPLTALFEFELYDSTIGQSRGTCGATIQCKTWAGQIGGSRILNATRVDQSGSDDANVTNWTKANDFILAVNLNCGGHATNYSNGVIAYYLRWKDITDAGAWADLNAAGELNYTADTDLVHNNAVIVGERECSTQGYTWRDGKEYEGDWSMGAFGLTNDNETELHFAIDCSGADDSHQYGFYLYAVGAVSQPGECGVKITMAAGAVTRELVTTITTTTATSASDVNILRPLTSTIATTTSTNAIELLITTLRELVATISTTTTTSTADINILREIATTSATATSTNAIDVLMLRELTATIPITTASTASLNILRELATSIDTMTLVSQINLLVGTLRELSTTIATSTSTSIAQINIVRELATTIATSTLLSAAQVKVLRELIATIDTTTSLSDIELITATLRELSATIATTTSTSDISADILRELTSSIDTATSVSDIELLITGLIELTATIATTTSTSAAQMNVVRELTSTIAAQTGSTAILSILRELTSTIATTSATSTATLNILRNLETVITTETSLSDIELLVPTLLELAATISTITLTSTPNLTVIREITSTINSTTSTSDVSLAILRALTAMIATGTDVSAAGAAVLRELSSTVSTETLTSSITLLVDVAAILVDTEIVSLTPDRTVESLTLFYEIVSLTGDADPTSDTVNRIIQSLTPDRTIESI